MKWHMERKKVEEVSNKLCKYYGKGEECHKLPGAPKWCTKADEEKCQYFKVHEDHNVSDENTLIGKPASNSVQNFDYSTVDEETGTFLQEKAKKISQMRVTFMLSVAVELEEVHNRLANHYKGSFGAWCESIGITDRTARNYLSGLNWVRKNFPNIDDAATIQPSLLFEASKPSAPAELQQAVISGDITTHKQYKELEGKLKAAEERAERAINQKFVAENKAIEAEQRRRKAEKDKDDSIRIFEKDINSLKQQLDQAKRNSDPTKVQELGQIISQKQQEIEELRKQLKEKPIEVPAVKEIEKIPEEIESAIFADIDYIISKARSLTDKHIEIYRLNCPVLSKSSVIEGLRTSIKNFKKLTDAIQSAESTRRCEDCKHVEYDGLSEKDEAAGYVVCRQEGFRKLALNAKGCDKFEEL